MKKLLILLIFLNFSLLSQVYRPINATTIYLSSNPESGYEYIISAPSDLNSSYTFSLPPTVGSAGEILMSLGDGSYVWADPSQSSISPGGGNTNIQYSLNGEFAGSSNLIWNNSTNRMTIGNTSGNFGLNIAGGVSSGRNGQTGTIHLHTGHASNYMFRLTPSPSMTQSATLTLPATNGVAGQFLVTDGQGNLSWTSSAVGGNFDCIGQGSGGGSGNTASGDHTFVGGGTNNTAEATSSVIGGGSGNEIESGSNQSAIAAGLGNEISGNSANSVIASGAYNIISEGSSNAAIGAGRYNSIINDADNSIIMSGEYNAILSKHCAIGAGHSNTISTDSDFSIIGAGQSNFIRYGIRNGILSGQNNIIIGTSTELVDNSTIAGGQSNTITSFGENFIGSGANNIISARHSSIVGGENNINDGRFSAILGGSSNTITTRYSMIFGQQSKTDARYTVAIGRRANSLHRGAFTLADNTDADLTSSEAHRLEMRFTGGYRLFTNTGLTTGMTLAAGGSSWAAVSDVNQKNNILSLDYNDFFNKISDLKITSWAYNDVEDNKIRHYGPMAQDFFKLFGKDNLGIFGSDKEIVTNHVTNVGFAALKGLISEFDKTNSHLEKLIYEQDEILNQLLILEQEINELESKLGDKK